MAIDGSQEDGVARVEPDRDHALFERPAQ